MSRRRCCCLGRTICPDCFYIFANDIDTFPDLSYFETVQLTTDPIPNVILILEEWKEISLNINQQQTQENILLYTNKLRQARRIYLANYLQQRLLLLPVWFRDLEPSDIQYNNCSICAPGVCGTTFALIENFSASLNPLMWGKASGYPSGLDDDSDRCRQLGGSLPIAPCFTPFGSIEYFCVDPVLLTAQCYPDPGLCAWKYNGPPSISGGLNQLELVLPDAYDRTSGCSECPSASPGDYVFKPQPFTLPSQQISFKRSKQNIICNFGFIETYCGHQQIFTDNTLDELDKITGDYFHCTKISGYTAGSNGNTYYPCVLGPGDIEGYDLIFGEFGCNLNGNSYDCSRCVDLGRDFYEYVHRNVTDDEVNIYNKRFSIIRLTMSFYATSFKDPRDSFCKQYSDYSSLDATLKDGNGNPKKGQIGQLTLFYYRPVADCEGQKKADYCFNRGQYELGYVIARYIGGIYGFSSGSIPALAGKALYQSTDSVSDILIYNAAGAPPGNLSGTPDTISRGDFGYPSIIELN